MELNRWKNALLRHGNNYSINLPFNTVQQTGVCVLRFLVAAFSKFSTKFICTLKKPACAVWQTFSVRHSPDVHRWWKMQRIEKRNYNFIWCNSHNVAKSSDAMNDKPAADVNEQEATRSHFQCISSCFFICWLKYLSFICVDGINMHWACQRCRKASEDCVKDAQPCKNSNA